MPILWLKSFHIVIVVSWYAGLVYLPRLFVNLAAVGDTTTTERLLLMARRLYRFTTMLAIVGIGLGLVLWLDYGIGKTSEALFSAAGWLQAKLAAVVLMIGYHHACGSILKKFENNQNKRSQTWFRVFNEVPVILLLAIVILVVVKPF